jgi:hypothetical protein
MPDVELEHQVLSLFVVPAKRDRCVLFASDARKRPKLLNELRQPSLFDRRWVNELRGPDRHVETLLLTFTRAGMGAVVYVISSDSDIDGQKLPLATLLPDCIASGEDTLAYCWSSQTAFYEQHHSGFTYFLSRASNAAHGSVRK